MNFIMTIIYNVIISNSLAYYSKNTRLIYLEAVMSLKIVTDERHRTNIIFIFAINLTVLYANLLLYIKLKPLI